MLALPIEEWSLKVSEHVDPDDQEEDLDLPYWAGVVPLHHVWGEPRPQATCAANRRSAPISRAGPPAAAERLGLAPSGGGRGHALPPPRSAGPVGWVPSCAGWPAGTALPPTNAAAMGRIRVGCIART